MSETSEEVAYCVCDKCGELSHGKQLKPWRCDRCGSPAFWQFDSPTKAFHHSMLIADRNRSVGAC